MTPKTEDVAEHKPKRLKRILGVFAIVLLLVTLTAYWQSAFILSQVASMVLGTKVSVEGPSWHEGFHAKRVRVYPSDKSDGLPLLDLQNIDAVPGGWPFTDGPLVETIASDDVKLHLALDEKGAPVSPWLREQLEGPAEPTPDWLVPTSIDLKRIDVAIESPRESGHLDGLMLQYGNNRLSLKPANTMTLTLQNQLPIVFESLDIGLDAQRVLDVTIKASEMGQLFLKAEPQPGGFKGQLALDLTMPPHALLAPLTENLSVINDIQALSAKTTFSFQNGVLECPDLTVQLKRTKPLTLHATAKVLPLQQIVTAEGTLFFDDQSITVSASSVRNQFAAECSFERFLPQVWWSIISEEPAPVKTGGLSGTINAALTPSGTIDWNLDLCTPMAPLVPALKNNGDICFAGHGTLDPSTAQLITESFAIRSEGLGTLTLEQVTLNTAGLTLNGHATSSLTLDGLQVPTLWGNLTLDTPLVLQDNLLTLPLTATIESGGYGDYALPYGAPLVLRTTVGWNIDTGLIDVSAGTAVVQKSQISWKPFRWQPEETFPAIPYTADIALPTLVDMMLLNVGEGELKMTGEVSPTSLDAAIDLHAEALALPDQVLLAENTVAKGTLLYKDASLDGHLDLTIGAALIAGMPVFNITAPFQASETSITSTGAEASLLNGQVRGNFELGVLRPGLPVSWSMRAKDLDLATFVEQTGRTELSLTGLASGTTSGTFADGSFTEFSVFLYCNNKGFSLDRASVLKLLADSGTEGKSPIPVVSGIVDKVVGKSPQRAFDRAELRLRLETSGRLEGGTVLSGNNLNLDTTLKMDPEALLDALSMAQEKKAEEIMNIRFPGQ